MRDIEIVRTEASQNLQGGVAGAPALDSKITEALDRLAKVKMLSFAEACLVLDIKGGVEITEAIVEAAARTITFRLGRTNWVIGRARLLLLKLLREGCKPEPEREPAPNMVTRIVERDAHHYEVTARYDMVQIRDEMTALAGKTKTGKASKAGIIHATNTDVSINWDAIFNAWMPSRDRRYERYIAGGRIKVGFKQVLTPRVRQPAPQGNDTRAPAVEGAPTEETPSIRYVEASKPAANVGGVLADPFTIYNPPKMSIEEAHEVLGIGSRVATDHGVLLDAAEVNVEKLDSTPVSMPAVQPRAASKADLIEDYSARRMLSREAAERVVIPSAASYDIGKGDRPVFKAAVIGFFKVHFRGAVSLDLCADTVFANFDNEEDRDRFVDYFGGVRHRDAKRAMKSKCKVVRGGRR